MAMLQSQNRQGAQSRDSWRLGLKVSVENGGLLEYFFGTDGKACLQHGRFVQFLRDLHDEVRASSPLSYMVLAFPYCGFFFSKDSVTVNCK